MEDENPYVAPAMSAEDDEHPLVKIRKRLQREVFGVAVLFVILFAVGVLSMFSPFVDLIRQFWAE